MNIIKNTNFKTHNTSVRTADIKYIVIHYTASNGGTAANHVSYFNNPSTTNASADFFVDENGIYQYNTLLEKRYSWAVGDGSGGTFGGKCNNGNQISIEMCCYQSGGKWYIKDCTYTNVVELVKYLMSVYNIPAANVIRHYDVSCKHCPGVSGWIPPLGESTWNEFKSAISGGTTTITPNVPQTNTSTNMIYRVRKSANDAKTQLGAYINLQLAKDLADKNSGYSVFDTTGKLIYTPSAKDTAAAKEFKVRVKATDLRIRSGAGTRYASKGYIAKGTYTITETKSANGYTWGKLKSGEGWIALEYTERV